MNNLYDSLTNLINQQVSNSDEEKQKTYLNCIVTLQQVINNIHVKYDKCNKKRVRKCKHEYVSDHDRFDPCTTLYKCKKCKKETY